MNKQSYFETLTMAKIYSDQGRLGKAADICRNLLSQTKDEARREKISGILSDIEKRIAERGGRDAGRLAPLFEKWFELALSYERLARLQKIKTDMARPESLPQLPNKDGV
jgi:hypothetical protein